MTQKKPGAKMGRPRLPNARAYVYGVRLDPETAAAAEKYRAAGGDLSDRIRGFVRRLLKGEGLM